MLCRSILSVLLLFCLTLPASALSITPPADPSLAAAAGRMKAKDYVGAREAALKAGDSGARAFLLGMASLKLELWEEAAAKLGAAAESYPILADYALYHQGNALAKLTRFDQALPPLYKLLKQYPESRLARPATLLYADTLAAAGYPKEALDSYNVFIDRYPAGGDSLSAQAGSALCREKLGDAATAAVIYRGIWLNHPGSTLSDKAQGELARLSAAGVKVEPYTAADLFKRGNILYDLGRYAQAAKAYAEVPLAGESPEFAAKVRLRCGQAQFKAKRYQDAEETLRYLAGGTGAAGANEASYWLGKALEKNGKSDQALQQWLQLAQSPQAGSAGDDALLDAAYLKRSQKKMAEALQLYQKYLAAHPDTQKAASVLWEAGWTSYQAKDYPGAAGFLKKLAGKGGENREKALYWLARALGNTGDTQGAQAVFTSLGEEFPFGYYALICNRWCEVGGFPTPPRSLTEALPVPAGFDREKALISLGLYDEAARELGAKKTRNALGIARLYLEMENYNGAYHAVAREGGKLSGKESASVWGVSYPLAYREEVAKNAAATAVPEPLIYAIMRCESNYSPTALSPVGAVGLMQLMPATAESMSKGDSVRLTRPELNIKLGTRYLKDQLATYDRSIPLTAAAYNAGPGNVKRWQKSLAGLPQDEFIESIPFRETREYVKKVVSTMELYKRLYRVGEEKKN